jgi:GNAT superfamily N-acetyltransferase
VRDSDGPQLEVLIRDCWSEYPDCVLDVDAEEPWLRAPAAAYVKYRGAHWVLDVDGVVIASVGMRPVPERAGLFEIKSLYVGAAARRTGFGARLVRRAERYAREQGATEIELWTDTRFLDAHRLYQRLGYAFTGVTRDLHDLSHTTEYEMLKRL